MTRSFWLIGATAVTLSLHLPAIAAQIGDVVPESALIGPVHSIQPGYRLSTSYLRRLQILLPRHGYRTGPVSGLLDSTTAAAILAYQHDAGLPSGTDDTMILLQTLNHVTYARPPVYASVPSYAPPAEMAPPAAINRPTPLEAPPQPLPEGPPQTTSPPGAINSPTPSESMLPPLPNEMPQTMSPPGAINSPMPIRPSETSGSNADQVRLVQEALKTKGYDIAVNGMLDLPTVNAIKAFQGTNDMRRSGTIDEALLEKLKQ